MNFMDFLTGQTNANQALRNYNRDVQSATSTYNNNITGSNANLLNLTNMDLSQEAIQRYMNPGINSALQAASDGVIAQNANAGTLRSGAAQRQEQDLRGRLMMDAYNQAAQLAQNDRNQRLGIAQGINQNNLNAMNQSYQSQLGALQNTLTNRLSQSSPLETMAGLGSMVVGGMSGAGSLMQGIGVLKSLGK